METDHTGIECVMVMWSFNSRYDWAMPRHRDLEDTRWTSISHHGTPAWQTTKDTMHWQDQKHSRNSGNADKTSMIETGVKPFAESIYRHAANEYHETYLSWKSIIWLQNLLEKKGIPYMFTLADNSLFYKDFNHHKDQDYVHVCTAQ